MPRRQFLADIQATADLRIPGIGSIERGPDDDVLISFIPATGPPIEIVMMAQPDVASYPAESIFMAYTNTQGVPLEATMLIEGIANDSSGLLLPDLVTSIAQKLQRALATGSRANPVNITDVRDTDVADADGEEDEEEEDWSEEEEYDPGDDDDFGLASPGSRITSNTVETLRLSPEAAAKVNSCIRRDIRAAKLAGLSVGVVSGMKAESVNSILCLSIRIAKLGLSEDALQAWDLEPKQYLMLLICYANGYKSLNEITANAARHQGISFRVGVGNKYKCTLLEALAAFSDTAKDMSKSHQGGASETGEGPQRPRAGFSNIFISSSLNEFLNSQFISLVRIRVSLGVGWHGAKRYLDHRQGQLGANATDLPAECLEELDEKKEIILSERLVTDHLTDQQVETVSFPFVAMQFTLRYLTRCTEFCLVCHDKIEASFEALKPYVCDKPLCLYQYMSLGFGPSVEHEIMTQPYVVDLLVSFCYASAQACRLRDYPTGMSLSVPPPPQVLLFVTLGHQDFPIVAQPRTIDSRKAQFEVRIDQVRHEIIFDGLASTPVHSGDWIVITVANRGAQDHYRVDDTSLFPTVKLCPMACSRIQNGSVAFPPTATAVVSATPTATPLVPGVVAATMAVYQHHLDDMNDEEKCASIIMLIETLPSIRDLRAYLAQQSRNTEPNLKGWKERISPAALGLLRWIIASNRSCILQVDRCPGQTDAELVMSKTKLAQRLSGVKQGWVQFRFAQGSPDKEQRFQNALRAQQSNFDSMYPTMFAWHGSPLPNWHSIIRTGLDFKETLHGRAHGHGVYHAMEQHVSATYASSNPSLRTWHGSELKIKTAMSLNEIVNCPDQFLTSTPFVVVQHVDWIQCRYLLVDAKDGHKPLADGAIEKANQDCSKLDEVNMVKQDPTRVCISGLGLSIGIPICAASISRSFRVDEGGVPAAKRRKKHSSEQTSNDWIESDGENISDLDFMFSDDERSTKKDSGVAEAFAVLDSKKFDKSLTDFAAGSLDQATLPMLQPPVHATPLASKALNRRLLELLAIQNRTPLHELGWYINPDLIGNLYQWIVELHSFDPSLPLAQDMKAAGVTSIVLEIRFGKDYPFSPPFVRVIRPRFLPFASGGGGHVTAGGAMCMELLTNTGWTAISTIESVLLQVRVEMMCRERPARLNSTRRQNQGDYGTAEAIEAYERSCKAHGWAIPPGFRDFANTPPISNRPLP